MFNSRFKYCALIAVEDGVYVQSWRSSKHDKYRSHKSLEHVEKMKLLMVI